MCTTTRGYDVFNWFLKKYLKALAMVPSPPWIYVWQPVWSQIKLTLYVVFPEEKGQCLLWALYPSLFLLSIGKQLIPILARIKILMPKTAVSDTSHWCHRFMTAISSYKPGSTHHIVVVVWILPPANQNALPHFVSSKWKTLVILFLSTPSVTSASENLKQHFPKEEGINSG
jgi:hypothetical protein